MTARWTHEAGPFECFGQRWMVRTTDEELAAFLEEAYATLRVRDDGRPLTVHSLLPPGIDGQGIVTRGDGDVIMTSPAPSALLGSLIWAINRQVIEGASGRAVLHAAAAARGESVVLLPAPMESGKTTLVMGLLDRGLSYLTDEAAALTGLEVEGFPKPLSIDPGSWEVLAHHRPSSASPRLSGFLQHQWQVPPQHVGPVQRRGTVTLVVFPRWQPGARLALEWLRPAEALQELLGCTFVPEGEAMSLDRVRFLAELAERVPAARLVHDDLRSASERIDVELAAQADRRRTPSDRCGSIPDARRATRSANHSPSHRAR
jgi:hypothetical protein